MYKPGQLITIKRNVYRVMKTEDPLRAGCGKCAFVATPTHKDPCLSLCIKLSNKMPNYGHYLKLVKSRK